MEIYCLKKSHYDGWIVETYHSETDAIAAYNHTSRFIWKYVNLFHMAVDVNHSYPVLIPIEKYVNGKWKKTKFCTPPYKYCVHKKY